MTYRSKSLCRYVTSVNQALAFFDAVGLFDHPMQFNVTDYTVLVNVNVIVNVWFRWFEA